MIIACSAAIIFLVSYIPQVACLRSTGESKVGTVLAEAVSDIITGIQEPEDDLGMCTGVLGQAIGLPGFLVDIICGWFDTDGNYEDDSGGNMLPTMESVCPFTSGYVRLNDAVNLTIQDFEALVAQGWGSDISKACIVWVRLKRATLEGEHGQLIEEESSTSQLNGGSIINKRRLLALRLAIEELSSWEDNLKKTSTMMRVIGFAKYVPIFIFIRAPFKVVSSVFFSIAALVVLFLRHILTVLTFVTGLLTVTAAALLLERSFKAGLGSSMIALVMVFGCSIQGMHLWREKMYSVSLLFIAAGSASIVILVLTSEIIFSLNSIKRESVYKYQLEKLLRWLDMRDLWQPCSFIVSRVTIDFALCVYSWTMFYSLSREKNDFVLLVPGFLSGALLSRDLPQILGIQVPFTLIAMVTFDPIMIKTIFSCDIESLVNIRYDAWKVLIAFRSAFPIVSKFLWVFYLARFFYALFGSVAKRKQAKEVMSAAFALALSVSVLARTSDVSWQGVSWFVAMVASNLLSDSLLMFLSDGESVQRGFTSSLGFWTLVGWSMMPHVFFTDSWWIIHSCTTARALAAAWSYSREMNRDQTAVYSLATIVVYGVSWLQLVKSASVLLPLSGLVLVCAVGAAMTSFLVLVRISIICPGNRALALWGTSLLIIVRCLSNQLLFQELMIAACSDKTLPVDGMRALEDTLYIIGIMVTWVASVSRSWFSLETKFVSCLALCAAMYLLPGRCAYVDANIVNLENVFMFLARALVEQIVARWLNQAGVGAFGAKQLLAAFLYFTFSASLSVLVEDQKHVLGLSLSQIAHTFWILAYFNSWFGTTTLVVNARSNVMKSELMEAYRLSFLLLLLIYLKSTIGFDLVLLLLSLFIGTTSTFIEGAFVLRCLNAIPGAIKPCLSLVVDIHSITDRLQMVLTESEGTQRNHNDTPRITELSGHIILGVLLFFIADVMDDRTFAWRRNIVEATSLIIMLSILLRCVVSAICVSATELSLAGKKQPWQMMRNLTGLLGQFVFLLARHQFDDPIRYWLWTTTALASLACAGIVHKCAASDGQSFSDVLQIGVVTGVCALAVTGALLSSFTMTYVNLFSAVGLVSCIMLQIKSVVEVSGWSCIPCFIALGTSAVVKDQLLFGVALTSLVPWRTLSTVFCALARSAGDILPGFVGIVARVFNKHHEFSIFVVLIVTGVSLMVLSTYVAAILQRFLDALYFLIALADVSLRWYFSLVVLTPVDHSPLPHILRFFPLLRIVLVARLVALGLSMRVIVRALLAKQQEELRNRLVVVIPFAEKYEPAFLPQERTATAFVFDEIFERAKHDATDVQETEEEDFDVAIAIAVQKRVRRYLARYFLKRQAALVLSASVQFTETKRGRVYGSRRSQRQVVLSDDREYLLLKLVENTKPNKLVKPKITKIDRVLLNECVISAKRPATPGGKWHVALHGSRGQFFFLETDSGHFATRLACAISALQRK
jgi:hypothetical protein